MANHGEKEIFERKNFNKRKLDGKVDLFLYSNQSAINKELGLKDSPETPVNPIWDEEESFLIFRNLANKINELSPVKTSDYHNFLLTFDQEFIEDYFSRNEFKIEVNGNTTVDNEAKCRFFFERAKKTTSRKELVHLLKAVKKYKFKSIKITYEKHLKRIEEDRKQSVKNTIELLNGIG